MRPIFSPAPIKCKNPDDPTDGLTVPRLPAAARALGMVTHVVNVREVTKLDAVSAEVASAGVQALFVGQGPTLNSGRLEITAMVARLRWPAMYGFREFTEAGGLMSYGPNLPDAYRHSARLVARILKGESPADLPIELPTRYELIVNLKAAKAIGLVIPDSFMLLADEVRMMGWMAPLRHLSAKLLVNRISSNGETSYANSHARWCVQSLTLLSRPRPPWC